MKPNLHTNIGLSDGQEGYLPPATCNFGPGAALGLHPCRALSSAQVNSNSKSFAVLKRFALKKLIITKIINSTLFNLNQREKSSAFWGHFNFIGAIRFIIDRSNDIIVEIQGYGNSYQQTGHMGK